MKSGYKNRPITLSFRDAIRGIWFCIKSERNMRIHTAVAAYLLFFAPFLKVTKGEYALLFAVIGIMITAEAFNTAIEKLCDFTCREHNRRIGAVKDISAGAVFISALFAVCIGVVVLWRPQELWALILLLCGSSLYLALFFLSVILILVYVFFGPVGIKKGLHKLFRRRRKQQ